MIRYVLVLKTGGDFKAEHAETLAHQIHRHSPFEHEVMLLTDDPEFGMPTLVHGWPGWWSMLEMFMVKGSAIYFDLDTQIVGTLEPLADIVRDLPPKRVLMLNEWGGRKGKEMATGITAWNGDYQWVTREFACQAARGQFDQAREWGKLPRAGQFKVDGKVYRDDQRWTPPMLRSKGYEIVGIQDILPTFAQSYKLDLHRGQKKPDGSIVVFHGQPRPWEVKC